MPTRIKINYRQPLQWILGVMIFVLVLMLALPLTQTLRWSGSTDLTVEFVTSDADTGQPIAGAKIKLYMDRGLDMDRENDFELMTGEDGTAHYERLNTRTSGSSGYLTNTFYLYIPEWQYTASSQGYQTRELIELDTPDNQRQVQRIRPGKHKLVVQIPLHRVP